MPTRPRLAAATAVAAALVSAAAPGASAGGSQTLDGVKRTHVQVTGDVFEPVVGDPQGRLGADVLAPESADCTDMSCDTTRLTLRLPRGVSTGRFELVATLPRTLNARVALYDKTGRELLFADPASYAGGAVLCCPDPSMYQLAVADSRLEAGSYTVIVYDNGGSGEFTLDVTYQARRPDRQPSKGKS